MLQEQQHNATPVAQATKELAEYNATWVVPKGGSTSKQVKPDYSYKDQKDLNKDNSISIYDKSKLVEINKKREQKIIQSFLHQALEVTNRDTYELLKT